MEVGATTPGGPVSVSVLLALEHPSLTPQSQVLLLTTTTPPPVLKHLPKPGQAVFQGLWPRQALMSTERH